MVAERARWLHEEAAALPLRPLIAEFTATFGVGWGPVTRRKHRDDFERFLAWLEATGVEPTTDALGFATLAAYVDDLRRRPKVRGVWRGSPDALAHALAAGPAETLSANSVNAYVRPLRSLVIWALHEGYLASNPFRRFRRRAALDPATLLANNGMPLEELSRYLGHASTQVTRRYAIQTPDALGERAAEALAEPASPVADARSTGADRRLLWLMRAMKA